MQFSNKLFGSAAYPFRESPFSQYDDFKSIEYPAFLFFLVDEFDNYVNTINDDQVVVNPPPP